MAMMMMGMKRVEWTGAEEEGYLVRPGRLNAAASEAAIVNFPLAWAFVLSFALAADKLL